MTTNVLITVDTELAAGGQGRGQSLRDNFESSILGRCREGDFGIGWQMDRLEASGLVGVFFVDPMPALVYGEQVVADMVGPILGRGHEVQLHIHTEWLAWARELPVAGRRGRQLANFSLDDQIVLLRLARDLLIRAGAPPPIAFRAGNYCANDDSLKALAILGIGWDTSFNPAYLSAGCEISLDGDQVSAALKDGVMVLPVSGLNDVPGHFRHAQVCAISVTEMRAALEHAARLNQPAFVVVSHSFEMLSRDRTRPNRAVMARFDTLCRMVAAHPSLNSTGFLALDAAPGQLAAGQPERLGPSYLRTAGRLIEQVAANWRYERRLRQK